MLVATQVTRSNARSSSSPTPSAGNRSIGVCCGVPRLGPPSVRTYVAAYDWHQLGLLLDPNDVDARVMDINQLNTLDPDDIHVARQTMVVGAQ
jgi:hypothetical protein